MTHPRAFFSLILASILSLGACSSGEDEFSTVELGKMAVQTIRDSRKPQQPALPQDVQLALQTKVALETADPGEPLATLTFQSAKISSVIRVIETNRSHLTWAAYGTAERRSIVTKGGMITATRRLPKDLMSANVDGVLALVANRREGAVQYAQRYLDGDHKIAEAKFTCEVTRGYESTVSLPNRTVPVLQMFSSCIAPGRQFVDLFMVDGSGRIIESRQWVGPGLGFAFVRYLR